LSLLRLCGGLRAYIVWFIIVSMNIMLVLTALCLWFPCQPIYKLWDYAVPGTCWSPSVNIAIGVASGGKLSNLASYHDETILSHCLQSTLD
jgi:hypothetical protein